MKYMNDENKSRIIRRLKLLEGQVRGLQKMVDSDTYCIDVITQTSAVKQGLSNVEDMLLEKGVMFLHPPLLDARNAASGMSRIDSQSRTGLLRRRHQGASDELHAVAHRAPLSWRDERVA